MKKRNVQYFAEVLHGVLQDVPQERVAGVIKDFLLWVERQGGASLFPRLLETYKVVADQAEGVVAINVQLARKMPEIEKIIKQAVKDKELTVTTSLDPTLLGGAIIQIDDLRLDASWRGQINDLKKVLAYGHH